MKKSLFILCFLLMATPAFAANYYVNQIITVQGELGPYQTTKIDYILSGLQLFCNTDNVADTATKGWALTKVECYDPVDYQELMGDSEIDMLPMIPFDVKMNAMAMEAMDAFQALLTKYGINGSCDAESSCRLSIRCVGQQIIPGWTEAAWSYF